jgi:hypothetical protein
LWVTLRGVVISLARVGATEDAALLYGATRNPRTGPAPFGADLDLLKDAGDRLRAALGGDFDARASAGAALSDDDVVRMALAAIEARIGPLGPGGEKEERNGPGDPPR